MTGQSNLDDAAELARAVQEIPWYHTIELPGGIVTPGEYDHRTTVDRSLPASLAGKRCLDVGTHDGFWAFEMERRGASEVVAIDLDDPHRLDFPGAPREIDEGVLAWLERRRQAFRLAHDALGSKVDRRDFSVYDLNAEDVGRFDFAFLGTLLHHLRDPIRALAAVRRVVDGEFALTAVFSISKTIEHPRTPVLQLMAQKEPFWEVPNIAALRRQLSSAGWAVDRISRPFVHPYGSGWRPVPIDLHPKAWSMVPARLLLRKGAPHVCVTAHPA
jgi:tRNA (mo5U34)-methyltransferase